MISSSRREFVVTLAKKKICYKIFINVEPIKRRTNNEHLKIVGNYFDVATVNQITALLLTKKAAEKIPLAIAAEKEKREQMNESDNKLDCDYNFVSKRFV